MKYIVLILLAVLYFTTEPTPCFYGCELTARLLFHFYHSNIWHLIANGTCIYAMRKFCWIESYVIAFLCSWVIISPTVGISGMVFAAIGCNLGSQNMRKGLLKCGASAVLFGILPGVSMSFHLACLIVGYFTKYLWRKYR